MTLNPGKWRVTYFFDKKDQTSNLRGYAFDFQTDGSLIVTKNGQTWSGTWSTGFDDSNNKLLLNFTGSVPSSLSELEEDWRIVTIYDDSMHLEHTSGGNGGTDVLKLERM